MSGGRWVTYPCWIGEAYGLVSVDLDPAENGPQPTRPLSCDIAVTLHDVSEDGLPSADELDRMHVFEAALAEALGAPGPLGHATHGGVRTTYWYSDNIERDGAIAAPVAARLLPEHEIAVGHFEDPEWEQYFEFLYPNALAWRYIYDNMILDNLRTHGDDGIQPRPIDHSAMFPSRGSRRNFTHAVEALGYLIKGKETGERGDPARFTLAFQPAEPMAPAEIHPHTERLVLLAEEHGGTYDGWGSHVCNPDDESAA